MLLIRISGDLKSCRISIHIPVVCIRENVYTFHYFIIFKESSKFVVGRYSSNVHQCDGGYGGGVNDKEG